MIIDIVDHEMKNLIVSAVLTLIILFSALLMVQQFLISKGSYELHFFTEKRCLTLSNKANNNTNNNNNNNFSNNNSNEIDVENSINDVEDGEDAKNDVNLSSSLASGALNTKSIRK